MELTKKACKFHTNYASLKSRGVDDKVYTLTVHKNAVKKAGFEFPDSKVESVKPENNIADDERFSASISRSRSAVIQLAANNPWEYFVTLTLKRDSDNFDAYDLNSVKKVLLKFFANYGMRSGADTDFKYLLIPEMHADGAWHFHGLLMGINPQDLVINEHGYWDFVPYRERFGFFNLGKVAGKATPEEMQSFADGTYSECGMGRINDLNKCASYISKYITKDMLGSTEAFQPGMHLYFASKGLKKDTVIVTGTPCNSIEEFIEQGHEVFENEHCAKVQTTDLDLALSWIKPFVNDVKHQICTVFSAVSDFIKKRIAFISYYVVLTRMYMNWVDYANSLPDTPYEPKFGTKWGEFLEPFPEYEPSYIPGCHCYSYV